MIDTIAAIMLIFGGLGALVTAVLFGLESLVWRRRARELQTQLDHANERVNVLTFDRDFWREEAYKLHCRNIEAMRRRVLAAAKPKSKPKSSGVN